MYPESNDYTPESAYSAADTIYAWISLVAAFLFCQAVPVVQHPLGAFLLILGLYASAFIILRIKKLKLDLACLLSAIFSLVVGFAPVLTDTEFIIKFSFAFALASYCYFIYAAFGNRVEKGFSNYIYIDFIKVLVLLPFCSLGAVFPALFNKSSQTFSRLFLKILLGLGMAIIPTIAVVIFLSYDAGFSKLLTDIFSFNTRDISDLIPDLVWTLPLAMYGFGLYVSSGKNVLQESMTVQRCEEGLKKAKFLPQLTALVAILPILFLYVLFFISQWQYYISGFTGVLPENFSYAQYARQGFFELCSVSVINLLIIVTIAFFIKRGENGNSLVLKIIATALCLCTLILISTAIAKLAMYIDYYGLTPKRIYAMWLMILIAIVFSVIALGQYLKKIKVVAVCFAVAVFLFSSLSVCNVNALCAQYNADQYLSGQLEELDIGAMRDLGDSAIPSLVRVASTMDADKDPPLKQQLNTILQTEYLKKQNQAFSFFSFSIPSALAKSALEEYIAAFPTQ